MMTRSNVGTMCAVLLLAVATVTPVQGQTRSLLATACPPTCDSGTYKTLSGGSGANGVATPACAADEYSCVAGSCGATSCTLTCTKGTSTISLTVQISSSAKTFTLASGQFTKVNVKGGNNAYCEYTSGSVFGGPNDCGNYNGDVSTCQCGISVIKACYKPCACTLPTQDFLNDLSSYSTSSASPTAVCTTADGTDLAKPAGPTATVTAASACTTGANIGPTVTWSTPDTAAETAAGCYTRSRTISYPCYGDGTPPTITEYFTTCVCTADNLDSLPEDNTVCPDPTLDALSSVVSGDAITVECDGTLVPVTVDGTPTSADGSWPADGGSVGCGVYTRELTSSCPTGYGNAETDPLTQTITVGDSAPQFTAGDCANEVTFTSTCDDGQPVSAGDLALSDDQCALEVEYTANDQCGGTHTTTISYPLTQGAEVSDQDAT